MASCPAEPDQTIHMLWVRRNEFVPLSPREGAPRKSRRTHSSLLVGGSAASLPSWASPVNPKVLTVRGGGEESAIRSLRRRRGRLIAVQHILSSPPGSPWSR